MVALRNKQHNDLTFEVSQLDDLISSKLLLISLIVTCYQYYYTTNSESDTKYSRDDLLNQMGL